MLTISTKSIHRKYVGVLLVTVLGLYYLLGLHMQQPRPGDSKAAAAAAAAVKGNGNGNGNRNNQGNKTISRKRKSMDKIHHSGNQAFNENETVVDQVATTSAIALGKIDMKPHKKRKMIRGLHNAQFSHNINCSESQGRVVMQTIHVRNANASSRMIMTNTGHEHVTIPRIYTSRSEFMDLFVQKETTDTEIHCIFRKQRQPNDYMHFPHTMQQIYPCWSLFQAHPDKRPILFVPPNFMVTSGKEASQKNSGNFNQGFFAALVKDFNISLRPSTTFEKDDRTLHPQQQRNDSATQPLLIELGTGYGLLPEDAFAMAHGMLSDERSIYIRTRNNVSNTMVCRGGATPSSLSLLPQPNAPKVGILDRQKSRAILNAKLLAGALKDNLNLSYNVEIAYFDHYVGFEEQIQFLARTDILISQHGAQLTGLPFLGYYRRHMDAIGTGCTTIHHHHHPVLIEILPEKYCLPSFFGSLALNSGHNYTAIALGSNGCEPPPLTTEERRVVRGTDLCPPIDLIVQVTKEHLLNWEQAT